MTSGPSKAFASLVIVAVLQLASTGAAAIPFTPFRYEHQAQRHCPDDSVVWVDFRNRKYYSKGQKLYGRGLSGSYVCRKEARSGFYRRALIGTR